jgi:hypothetical protein
MFASGFVARQRNAGDRLHHYRLTDNGTAYWPAPGDTAALFEAHDADAVALVATEDVVAGQILAHVEADMPAASAVEHQYGSRCNLRRPCRPGHSLYAQVARAAS